MTIQYKPPTENPDILVRWSSLLIRSLYFGGLCSILVGIAVFSWQIFEWLHTGKWYSISIQTAFMYLDVDLSAINSPADWFGLFRIIQRILDFPLTIGLPIAFFAVASFCDWLLVVNKD